MRLWLPAAAVVLLLVPPHLAAAPAVAAEPAPPPAAAPPSAAQSPLFDPARHMRVAEVKPGMRGYGLSVFSGTKIDRFEVEVVAVLRNFNPKSDVVLIRCRGANLEHTGAIAGIQASGSRRERQRRMRLSSETPSPHPERAMIHRMNTRSASLCWILPKLCGSPLATLNRTSASSRRPPAT